MDNNVINALIGMLYQPEERRLTQSELHERVEITRFENIMNPLNTVCSITHDVFEPTQRVARIRQCGHIFNSESLEHWLRMNNTCPTCRHNLRNNATTNATTNTRSAAIRRVFDIPLETEVNINTVYNELLRNGQNIPGFELNSVNDDSIVFSFDLINRAGSSGSSGSGSSGAPSRDID
jgi:predicted Zn-ribbon and HTH transcriptional regulator